MLKVLLLFTLLGGTQANDNAVWLARSCVGEAGFESGESGECAAIHHVYLKRSRMNNRRYAKIMHNYSAAIRYGHGKRWVRGLRADGGKPPGFGKLDWSNYRDKWLGVLETARKLLAGEISDPLPDALHYGGWTDRHRLDRRYWQPIKNTGFRNTFYAKRKTKRGR